MQSGGNVFIEGTPTEVHFPLGISADMGATFGGDVNIGSNSIRAGTNSTITDGSGDPIFDIVADRHVKLGDTDGSGNSTYITCRDSHSHVDIRGDTSITLQSDTVSVNETIRCKGDVDTKIVFYGASSPNKLDFIAGGVTFAGSKQINSVPRLYAPMGITVGYASGGAQGAGNIYTPYGVTCGSLEVGGYWAGVQEETIGVSVNNGSSVLTTGVKGHRTLPYACDIVDWRVTSTDSGAIEWGINYCTYANFPTMTANSIHASEAPGIAATGSKDESAGDIAGGTWTKYQFDAGDIIEFEIDSVTTLTNCILELTIRRTS
jgi:hypothetical protein